MLAHTQKSQNWLYIKNFVLRHQRANHICHKLWTENCEMRQIFKWDLINFCEIFTTITLKLSINRQKPLWAPSSEFVSSSIPSRQILTAHAQPFRGTRDLAFCLKVPLDSLLVWASSGGSGETVRMRRLAWTFIARIGYKYQIRLTRSLL